MFSAVSIRDYDHRFGYRFTVWRFVAAVFQYGLLGFQETISVACDVGVDKVCFGKFLMPEQGVWF